MILCLGGAHMDRTSRLAGAAVLGSSNPARTVLRPGGVAANVARLTARLGHETAIASLVGTDRAGDDVIAALIADGVDPGLVGRDRTRPTAEYGAVVDGAGALVVGVADMEIYDHMDARWLAPVVPTLRRARAVVVDANLPAATLQAAAAEAGGTVLADPVSVGKCRRLAGVLGAIDVLFPDRAEAGALGGSPTESPAGLRRAAAALRTAGVGAVVVSLGGDGLYVDDGASPGFLRAVAPDRVVSVTGAGDALVAGYLHGLLSGHGEPLQVALAAASLVVEGEESVPPHFTRESLAARLGRV